jgi:hypothetical protein
MKYDVDKLRDSGIREPSSNSLGYIHASFPQNKESEYKTILYLLWIHQDDQLIGIYSHIEQAIEDWKFYQENNDNCLCMTIWGLNVNPIVDDLRKEKEKEKEKSTT